MTTLDQIRALLPQCTGQELVTLVYEILNAQGCSYSDRVADVFYRPFLELDAAIDEEMMARPAECYVPARAA